MNAITFVWIFVCSKPLITFSQLMLIRSSAVPPLTFDNSAPDQRITVQAVFWLSLFLSSHSFIFFSHKLRCFCLIFIRQAIFNSSIAIISHILSFCIFSSQNVCFCSRRLFPTHGEGSSVRICQFGQNWRARPQLGSEFIAHYASKPPLIRRRLILYLAWKKGSVCQRDPRNCGIIIDESIKDGLAG